MHAPNFGRFLWVVLPALFLTACGARTTMELGEWADAGPETDAKLDAPSDVVYDHVNDINGCNPSTCGGCCDLSGNCRTGLEASACGQDGYQCVDCSAFNASCNASTHTCGAAQECGPATCPKGCCNAQGLCVDGAGTAACGTGGKACVACPAGSNCDFDARVCVGTGECGPWNCGGCCDPWGNCNWGGDPWACGVGGGLCEDCGMFGQTCDPYSYTCTNTQDCGPWNCGGCCDAYGSCNWGGDSWACGYGGYGCSDCWSMGLTCDSYQGVCTSGQDCGPWNCDGCCDPWGTCSWGGSDWACGVKGQACQDCSAYGGYCDPMSLTCSVPVACGPGNCYGCCDPYSNECRTGWDSWACGTSGQVCQNCNDPGTQCVGTSSGGGLCVSTNPTCGPNNCKGCCECDGTSGGCKCLDGYDSYACGSGGQVCQDCNLGAAMCQPSPIGGGQCVNVPPPQDCGPWNCGGCCTNTYPSQCVGGLDSWQCGSGGQMCTSCYPGQTCAWQPWGGGVCTSYPDGGLPPDGGVPDAMPVCGPWNCGGCCTPAGQCRPGLSDQRCGRSGEVCENCAVQNLVCVDGDCGSP
jgi:hypothetical protein